jgi:hypothetical protein
VSHAQHSDIQSKMQTQSLFTAMPAPQNAYAARGAKANVTMNAKKDHGMKSDGPFPIK